MEMHSLVVVVVGGKKIGVHLVHLDAPFPLEDSFLQVEIRNQFFFKKEQRILFSLNPEPGVQGVQDQELVFELSREEVQR